MGRWFESIRAHQIFIRDFFSTVLCLAVRARKNEAGHMSLKEIVEAMKAKGGGGAPASLRVYATEERRWKTLTGHGPDPKKVGVSFPLLNSFS